MGSHGDLWPIPLLATLSALYCSASSCARPARGPRPTIPPMHVFGPLNRDGREILAGESKFSAERALSVHAGRVSNRKIQTKITLLAVRFLANDSGNLKVHEYPSCFPPRQGSNRQDLIASAPQPTVPITFPGTPIFWFVGISIWLVRDEGLRNGMGTHRACSSRAAR